MHRSRQSASAIRKIATALIVLTLAACGTKGPLTPPMPQTDTLSATTPVTGGDLSTTQKSTHNENNPT